MTAWEGFLMVLAGGDGTAAHDSRVYKISESHTAAEQWLERHKSS